MEILDDRYDPISKLNPYTIDQQLKVGICNVANKTSNKDGKTCKIQTIEFMDYKQDKIQTVLFNDTIEQYSDIVKVGNLVKIKNFGLILGRDKKYELRFHAKTKFSKTSAKSERDERLEQLLCMESISGSTRKTISEIKSLADQLVTKCTKLRESKQMIERADEEMSVTLRATIVSVTAKFSTPPWYMSCPNDECANKGKILPLTKKSTTLMCEECDQIFETGKPRFATTIKLSDATGELTVRIWDDTCSQLLNISASDLAAIHEEGKELEFMRVISRPQTKEIVVKLLGKMFINEEQDEMRVDFQIKSMIGFKNLNETMDYESECKLLRIL